MEANLCIRAYFNSAQQCKDILELLNEYTRPVFVKDEDKNKRQLFKILEFAESPDTAQRCLDNSIYVTWFIGSDESTEQIVDDLLQCGALDLFALVDADDYCEFYKKIEGKNIRLTRETEKSELTDSEIKLSSMALLEKEYNLRLCNQRL